VTSTLATAGSFEGVIKRARFSSFVPVISVSMQRSGPVYSPAANSKFVGTLLRRCCSSHHRDRERDIGNPPTRLFLVQSHWLFPFAPLSCICWKCAAHSQCVVQRLRCRSFLSSSFTFPSSLMPFLALPSICLFANRMVLWRYSQYIRSHDVLCAVAHSGAGR